MWHQVITWTDVDLLTKVFSCIFLSMFTGSPHKLNPWYVLGDCHSKMTTSSLRDQWINLIYSFWPDLDGFTVYSYIGFEFYFLWCYRMLIFLLYSFCRTPNDLVKPSNKHSRIWRNYSPNSQISLQSNIRHVTSVPQNPEKLHKKIAGTFWEPFQCYDAIFPAL